MIDEHKGQSGKGAGDGPHKRGDQEHIPNPEPEFGGATNGQTDKGNNMKDKYRLPKLNEAGRA
ncbi:Potassium transporter peripheral membrane component (modular protein) [Vibrio nigripulchritudo SO65]|nr:Potassium transporter peripheral membrane component (modular protein) [Vibrio nigripulchritudo AM115]CCN42966.1 Potassium transporter peripheral membrane component (modular protein) [Vibrio nigripulchritudo FTn2]CCN65391.1 Potassium transporter peripheral membrane component (modular protein) [Vibrio nigripulchritudo POn4]CCN79456.1 Potassium transporter peripheral membrane component (modular protein) [Vibrio nigripulchritudo SO65]